MRNKLLIAMALAAAPFCSFAQDQARSLAATCANCHGTDGRTVGGAIEPLAGRSKDEIVRLMQQFKTGARPATVMHQLSKGYSDQQIEQIAGYFAARKK